MAQLTSVIQYLNALLEPGTYRDHALNGLQVESSNAVIQKVAVAVDAGQSVISAAVEQSSDLLIVHHGLFWGESEPITGALGKKIQTLISRKCSLYASHLPLDGNLEVGNAFELGRFLQLDNLERFCEYHGMTIGAKGTLSRSVKLSDCEELLSEIPQNTRMLSLGFGTEQISRVGIVTGSGSS
ncbi:MAG: Nif3-like dinuclear metal center hexameric protein, partial [Bdellovibrionales bacterium]|nr:Nif3-like dinuclear metal center hexameric protein [Bdellovibrionales bacterium]